MGKVDLRKELKQLYQPSSKTLAEVEVPAFTFLMIDGQGDPNHATAYAQAVEALFSVAYTAKFLVKKGAGGQDYSVMPLEGLWWADDMRVFHAGDRERWCWTMMIMQPSFVPQSLLREAITVAAAKKDLTDIRRADPSRWKTVIRQPME